MMLEEKREALKTLVSELYGYVPNCKNTIKNYKEYIFTHFENKKDALIYIDRNIEIRE